MVPDCVSPKKGILQKKKKSWSIPLRKSEMEKVMILSVSHLAVLFDETLDDYKNQQKKVAAGWQSTSRQVHMIHNNNRNSAKCNVNVPQYHGGPFSLCQVSKICWLKSGLTSSLLTGRLVLSEQERSASLAANQRRNRRTRILKILF